MLFLKVVQPLVGLNEWNCTCELKVTIAMHHQHAHRWNKEGSLLVIASLRVWLFSFVKKKGQHWHKDMLGHSFYILKSQIPVMYLHLSIWHMQIRKILTAVNMLFNLHADCSPQWRLSQEMKVRLLGITSSLDLYHLTISACLCVPGKPVYFWHKAATAAAAAASTAHDNLFM